VSVSAGPARRCRRKRVCRRYVREWKKEEGGRACLERRQVRAATTTTTEKVDDGGGNEKADSLLERARVSIALVEGEGRG
jgi:aspartate aminotransferase-like enzyme